MAGTAQIGSGALTVAMPSSLSWTTVLDSSIPVDYAVDTRPQDQFYAVTDDTALMQGWSVSASVAPWVNGTGAIGNISLITSGDSSPTGYSSTTAPSNSCAPGGTCVPVTESAATLASYPVTVSTTSTSPSVIYDAIQGTGAGSTIIGLNPSAAAAVNPTAWWISFPSDEITAGTYSTTITVNITSPGPMS